MRIERTPGGLSANFTLSAGLTYYDPDTGEYFLVDYDPFTWATTSNWTGDVDWSEPIAWSGVFAWCNLVIDTNLCLY